MNDTIILKFEIETNLEDIQDRLDASREVAEYMKGFKKRKLMNIGVEYIGHPEQKVKQSPEFLKAHPDYDKPKVEPKVEKKSRTMDDVQADFYAQDTWKKVRGDLNIKKNGGKKNGNGKKG